MRRFRRSALPVLAAIAGLAGPLATQGPAQPEAIQPLFEVASVKPYKDDGVGPRRSHSSYGPQGIDFAGRSLAFIIAEAYHVPGGRIVGPGSLTKQALWGPLTQGYDIVAKADHAVPKEQLRLMLQSLLADCFQLKVHWETKTGPVYTLVIAKNGPKIEESQAEGDLVMSRGSDGFVFRKCGNISASRVLVELCGSGGRGWDRTERTLQFHCQAARRLATKPTGEVGRTIARLADGLPVRGNIETTRAPVELGYRSR
jgi:uncharacterized protein (TIGR03435 family)